MNSLRKYARRLWDVFPAFFLASLFFCAIVQFGPEFSKRDASNAMLGVISFPFITLLFIACTGLTGLALLAFGSLSPQSSALKRWVFGVFVEKPANFIIDLTLPMIAVICALIVACFLFGFVGKIPQLAWGVVILLIFASLNIGLVEVTRSALLSRIDAMFADGRIAGVFLIGMSVLLFYWVLPLKSG